MTLRTRSIIALLAMAVPVGICVKWWIVPGIMTGWELLAVMAATIGCMLTVREPFPFFFNHQQWHDDWTDKLIRLWDKFEGARK